MRWVAIQAAGNAYLAAHPSTVRDLLPRLKTLSDAPRMLGLTVIANLYAHPPGTNILATAGMPEMIMEVVAESLTAEKVLERRTAAALMVNFSLGIGREMDEALAVQALC